MRSSQEQGQGGPQALYLAPSLVVQLVTAGGEGAGWVDSCVGHSPAPTPPLLASPKCPPLLSHLSSLTPTVVPGRYLCTAEPGRPRAGSDALPSNPPGPGVGAGHRLWSGSVDPHPHSSGYSWTRVPKGPSLQLPRNRRRSSG